MTDLRKSISDAINRCSAENGSDTPDFILAQYLVGCLQAFDAAVKERERWYGREKRSGGSGEVPVNLPSVVVTHRCCLEADIDEGVMVGSKIRLLLDESGTRYRAVVAVGAEFDAVVYGIVYGIAGPNLHLELGPSYTKHYHLPPYGATGL
ncbi:MAG: hypothetical protein WC505_06265 [Patescibacteria group bacterium]